ncbi:MAG: PQQ-binding-like beta-propeller repeat protein [Planctomycetota bacterium]|nr:PQQ-binding-like beta-propeller repeat protein [Planctomycetota bacterium]
MNDATNPAPNRVRPRWLALAAILALSGAALAYVRLSEPIVVRGMSNGLTLALALATGGALVLWFAFLSGLPRRARFAGLGLAAAGAAGLALCLRVEGYHGDILPVLTWRWAPPRDYTLPELAPKVAEAPPAGAEAPGPLVEAAPGDWSRFLGPRGDGWAEAGALPAEWWTRAPKERWRRACGAGWAGCAVAGDRVYTQEQRGPYELVVCVGLDDGKEKWVHRDEARFSEEMGGDGPRATPTVSEGIVYALGATGILNALDARSGELRWSRNVLAESGQPNLMWGKSASPVVYDGRVVVTLGGAPEGTTAAFRCADGEPAWRAGADQSSYSTPALGQLAGARQLVVVYADSIAGHDPAGGKTLWTYAWKGAPAKVASPKLLDGDRVLLTVGYGLGARMLKVSRAGDGGDAASFGVEVLWQNLNLKTKFTNPVLKDGCAYGLDEGRLACVRLEDGERLWKGDSFGHGQLIGAGDVLIVQAERGEVVFAAASPEAFKVWQRIPALKDKTWNYPALSGRNLIVRNDREMVCLELQ